MFVDPYLATVTIFGGNFAPRGWMFCQGQLLSIAEYNALYALIGTTYGGDGNVTFGLPDLRSRRAISQGAGPGLPNYSLGEMSGNENVTLVSSNLPPHNHLSPVITGTPKGSTDATGSSTPGNTVVPAAGQTIYSANEGLASGPYSGVATTTIAGGNQPVPIIGPYLAMNYIIATEGIFPSRN